MNTDVSLWLDILDKTENLIRSARPSPPDCLDTAKFIRELEARERMLSSDAHFTIAFSGMTNVGKSTLMNALLGDVVAPTKNTAWSSTAVEYQYSEDGYEMIVPLEGFRSLHKRFRTSEDLLSELNQFAVEGGDFQTDQSLVVRIPNELLKGDLTIVDTPGFGASDGSDEKALHDDILLSYLKKRQDDLRVFWIVKDNINESALDFFKNHLNGICRDLVINLTDDDFSEDDRRNFEKTYKKSVGHTMRFHYINAKKAVKAEKKNDEKMLESSGINRFKDYLTAFSSQENRTILVAEDLKDIFQDLQDYLYLTNHYSCTWRRTAWGTLGWLLRKTENKGIQETFSRLEKKDGR